MTMAKALGGGMAIGAMMARDTVAASLVPGKHASTFGGNHVACAAGVAVIEAIEEGGLIEKAAEIGQYTQDKLLALKETYSIIQGVRGKGLMIGVQLNAPGGDIVSKCLARGLRINCTQDTVLRVMPPMIAEKEHIDKAMEILQGVLGELDS
ncbi:MAG: aminotransferase class III-fold pyridoxal phosphate-dependent enzyme, partial [Planctomycetes bacterium]|nr:aminotransferase class III-fold pyridoxal phosphate-dependent enzyme [Planctomycetota bacterium]